MRCLIIKTHTYIKYIVKPHGTELFPNELMRTNSLMCVIQNKNENTINMRIHKILFSIKNIFVYFFFLSSFQILLLRRRSQ